MSDYHRAHLLIAADCSAFAYPNFHRAYACGKVVLTCCTESDFDIMTKLSEILLHNDVKSITVVKTDKPCCTFDKRCDAGRQIQPSACSDSSCDSIH